MFYLSEPEDALYSANDFLIINFLTFLLFYWNNLLESFYVFPFFVDTNVDSSFFIFDFSLINSFCSISKSGSLI